MKSHILRRKFLDYFKQKKHKLVESDSLVPREDPTVLFTPAGMNQFKKEFMGFDSGFSRAATCQRCLRTDDLDKVGKTRGHHTFFEMLGNFSFGDYFKKDAIQFAWEFLTKELRIPQDRLWVSVYTDDDEAYGIWSGMVGVPKERIVRLGDHDNFWPADAKEKGPNGPCGPCSEIFFDQGASVGCELPACNPACSCGRFLEVWNLVFTQYNRLEGGKLEPLPNKNIDTGMGLERLAAVMQGVPTNFDTDLFQPIIKELAAKSADPTLSQSREYMCAIADHVRAAAFAIYDGVLPSNEARGYVVRKLIRKSVLHLKALGIKKPFLTSLVPVLAQIMEPEYPELKRRRENIAELILAEEQNFHLILNSSGTLLKEAFASFVKNPDPVEAGRTAFRVYDTYGLPFELTHTWLKEQGIELSLESYQAALEEQKSRSKQQSTMKGDVFTGVEFDYGVSSTGFLGYRQTESRSKILRIFRDAGNGRQEVKKIGAGEQAIVLLDKTVFYPESGGQIGDTGQLVKGKSVFKVEETRKLGKIILHKGTVEAGTFRPNDPVDARIEENRRLDIARNHTATHMLQSALRKVLGMHVQQQGSLVAEDRLRFDFTHFKELSDEQLERVEELVNEYILSNFALESKQMPLAEAKKEGALAFFGEKYDAKVRVVSIGDVSRELCGGTHLENTGQIGVFKIIQESSVASGVRRIEAVTGLGAYRFIAAREKILKQSLALLNIPAEKLPAEIERRIAGVRELEKKFNAQKLADARGSMDVLIAGAQQVNGVAVIIQISDGLEMDILRSMVDMLKQKVNRAVIALGSRREGRALLVVGVTQDAPPALDAGTLVRGVAGILGGSGGGRRDFAQAGGTQPDKFDEAMSALRAAVGAAVAQA